MQTHGLTGSNSRGSDLFPTPAIADELYQGDRWPGGRQEGSNTGGTPDSRTRSIVLLRSGDAASNRYHRVRKLGVGDPRHR